MLTQQELLSRLKKTDNFRQNLSLSNISSADLSRGILNSWQRSYAINIPKNRTAAPLQTASIKDSLLQNAVKDCESKLNDIVSKSSMIIGIADISSTIVWTSLNKQMMTHAENVNFIKGGQWCEKYVGTNALDLVLQTQQSSCVFANEHYMESIHDWVCYAAPIIDPQSHHILGVIDLSTKWQNHNNFGLLAVEHCANTIHTALINKQKQQLYIKAFGSPKVTFQGKTLPITPRQMEILTILSLCPDGLSLADLHYSIYGERKVSLGTLKTELSQLRELLNGLLGSRPYRILVPVDGDFLQAEKALDVGYFDGAINLYKGVFLVKSESPFLTNWRNCFEYRLSKSIYNAEKTDLLMRHLSHFPESIDIIERLIELIPKGDPIHEKLLNL